MDNIAVRSDVPYNVGEVVPGWCGGTFSLDTMDDDLRVEAVGFDWVVLRGARDGEVHFYQGTHSALRQSANWEMQHRRDREAAER
jgi:hypothetical protein